MVAKDDADLFSSTIQPLLEDKTLKAGEHYDIVSPSGVDSESAFAGRLNHAAGNVCAEISTFKYIFYGCKGRHCVSHFQKKAALEKHLVTCKQKRWRINCELPLCLYAGMCHLST